MWWPTPASRSAASKLRDEVVKNPMTASSSQTGAFDTSTTASAPTITSARPSPVIVSTPVEGEAGSGSCPWATSRRTTLRPISPLPPMTTTLMTFLPVVVGDVPDHSRARGTHPSWGGHQSWEGWLVIVHYAPRMSLPATLLMWFQLRSPELAEDF